VVLFAEGGGGRPGDVDMPIVAGLHVPTFASFARLSGRVPLIGIVAGRCFAGNAALLGCCDVVIATRGSSIGMGGRRWSRRRPRRVPARGDRPERRAVARRA
jgi:acetyl-CoA carboxylase carboxyltransferase component